MYLLDTNVFITAKNLYYGLDFHPGFWDWLTQGNTEGRVFSIKKVFDEICSGEDHLTEWAREHKDELFLDPPSGLEIHLGLISEYIKMDGFNPNDIWDFVSAADYYLVGHALARNFKVVTNEIYQPTKAAIKIPQVCKKFRVECITPFEMLRQESTRFVLDLLQ